MKRIVSAAPGRFRIKDHALRDAELARQFIERLTQQQQGESADLQLSTRINPEASSVVVAYDASKIRPAELQQRTEQLLTEMLGQSPRLRGRRSKKLRINRYAKIAALSSLGASMAFAAVGHKRLHVITGGVFLACLGVHLAVFRRNLVR